MRIRLLLVPLIFLVAACGSDAPPTRPGEADAIVGTWVMSHVNDAAPPYTLQTSPYRFDVTGGVLSLSGSHIGGYSQCVMNMRYEHSRYQGTYSLVRWGMEGDRVILRYDGSFRADTAVIRSGRLMLDTWNEGGRFTATFTRTDRTPTTNFPGCAP